jgi:CubicO group peptidase (beta-lactamase class C family)/beta-glucosidase-like glycosyl hydrolase
MNIKRYTFYTMYFKSTKYILITILLQGALRLFAQEIDPPYLKYMHHPWVDSVFNSLSPEEKIGQLIWIKASSDGDIGQDVWLSNVIKKAGAGGIVFSGGFTADRQTNMLNHFQKITKVPLLIAEEGEYGSGLNLEGVVRFPDRITLGAIQDDSLIYQMGKAAADQFKRAGFQIKLTSVTDLKNNQQNLATNYRSFGENPENVRRKTIMFTNGLQDNGIISAVIHFTGNSDTGKIYQFENSAGVISLKRVVDVPEYSEDPEQILKKISESIKKGLITQDSVEEKCRIVLAIKYQAGVSRYSFVDEKNLMDELSPASTAALVMELYANSLTVLRNENNILPVRNLEKTRIATVSVNKYKTTLFQDRISKYQPADNYFIDPSDIKAADDLLSRLSQYDIVIAGIYGTDNIPQAGFRIKPEMTEFLEKLIGNNRTIITWFGNPYLVDSIRPLKNSEGLVLTYQQNEFTEDISAQLIFGGIGARGSLPVTINEMWPNDFGIMTRGNIRMQYGLPENAGLSSEFLNRKIDSIADIGLRAKAYPGCEVMVARKGIVVFQKTYGFHTYENRISVQENDLFDLASVTKVSSTLAGLMLLDSEGKFSVEKRLGDYLSDFRKTNKGNLLMKDLLTHQAGLKDWIPFWKETVKPDSSFKRRIFSHEYSEKYPLKVANDLYINKNYRKKIFNEIKKSPLGEKKYVYSDLTFIISPGIIEKLTGEKWYDFVTKNIYHKLGAYDICFNPYLKYPFERIIPTEYDSLFRRQLLHGTVHDEGAAMLGGISGHAGLFSTANDLMKLMELYRHMGEYGGEQLIEKDVFEKYTKVQFPENNNRRGLGFDKPLLNNQELSQEDAYPAKSASPQSFGHSGYTGTFVWIDPVYEISYIFLSNRVYPTRNNTLLSDLNIRTNILQAVYDSINDTGHTARNH